MSSADASVSSTYVRLASKSFSRRTCRFTPSMWARSVTATSSLTAPRPFAQTAGMRRIGNGHLVDHEREIAQVDLDGDAGSGAFRLLVWTRRRRRRRRLLL